MKRLDPTDVQLEITHACNLRCPLCDHRISTSSYAFLSRGEYDWIAACLGSFRGKVRRVVVTGGEPLLHPDLGLILASLRRDFPRARILVRTNGLLLNRLATQLPDEVTYMVSWFPGRNDCVAQEFGDVRNVILKRVERMQDPSRDPGLPPDRAKALHAHCRWRMLRLVGSRMYGCCLAEGLERAYRLAPIGLPITLDWRQALCRLETWRACCHCHKAFELGFAQ
jgi:hypothetical protein